jgi:hypothetical protein
MTRLIEDRVVGDHSCHDNARNGTHIGKDRRQQVHEHQALKLTRSTMHDRALRSAASSRSSPQFKCALRPSNADCRARRTVDARRRWRDQAAKFGTAAIFERLTRLGTGLF